VSEDLWAPPSVTFGKHWELTYFYKNIPKHGSVRTTQALR